MLTNSIYIENQLNTKRIKLYLKRIIILIRRNEIRKLTRKEKRTTTLVNNYQSKTTWDYKENSINIDVIESKKRREIRKCFKCKKEDHIRRFYRIKQKKTTLATFDASENEEVLK